jgi:hypothetical protein
VGEAEGIDQERRLRRLEEEVRDLRAWREGHTVDDELVQRMRTVLLSIGAVAQSLSPDDPRTTRTAG